MSQTVLIVDDEIDIQSSLSFALKDEHYEVVTASSPKEAEKILATRTIDLGLFDVWFPEGDGLELLQVCRERYPRMTLIMMSGHGNIELALKSIRLGAYDFLEKPLELEKVLVVLRNAFEALNLRKQNQLLSAELGKRSEVLGTSPVIEQLKKNIARAAPSPAPVLILGENGVGKEIVARSLHAQSERSARPFVKISCASLGEDVIEKEFFGVEGGLSGRFEEAGDGTVFLDEIASLSLAAQAKLLRLIEEKKFERVGGRRSLDCPARIVVATNRDLQAAIREGRFREDLYFRLNVVSIHVPPLRDRGSDISLLADFFLSSLASDYGRSLPKMSADLREWMLVYDWPGNVRELRNLIERMLILGGEQSQLGLADLPEELQGYVLQQRSQPLSSRSGPLRELRAEYERQLLAERLEAFGNNVTKAAESLGIERAHLHRKLRQFGIKETVT